MALRIIFAVATWNDSCHSSMTFGPKCRHTHKGRQMHWQASKKAGTDNSNSKSVAGTIESTGEPTQEQYRRPNREQSEQTSIDERELMRENRKKCVGRWSRSGDWEWRTGVQVDVGSQVTRAAGKVRGHLVAGVVTVSGLVLVSGLTELLYMDYCLEFMFLFNHPYLNLFYMFVLWYYMWVN